MGSEMIIVFLLLLSLCAGQNCGQYSFSSSFTSKCNKVNNMYRYGKNCLLLWKHFRNGFYGKKDRQISKSSYNQYAAAAHHSLQKDKVTFYSGLKELGIKGDLLSISRTMLGGPVNEIHWIADPVVGYRFQNSTQSKTEIMFWRRVSMEYASLAEGQVQILLDGTRESAFSEKTILAMDEIPNLNRTKVTSVTVYVVTSNNQPRKDSCGGESLIRLRHLIEKEGMIYCCIDNQDSARQAFCYPRSNGYWYDCWKQVPDITVNTAPMMSKTLWTALIVSLVCLCLLCVLYFCCRKKLIARKCREGGPSSARDEELLINQAENT